ncbi:MAG: NAD-dependent deacylase [Flavobacteriales bacterium]|nr:NAD-dependent deacylase [Flavobacteriales bacterium]
MTRERIVVFTGAGISAESGLRTFRDGDGLWEQYHVEDVATPEAWRRDMDLVLRFYDERRSQVLAAHPNAAHRALVDLEKRYTVDVITQNIDDLHERAGSTSVLHLHGEILKARSTVDPSLITRINGPSLQRGAKCPLGSQLRPHIVWFGEAVPMLEKAAAIISKADRLMVIGTSLNVYPAASLIHHAPQRARLVLIDPKPVPVARKGFHCLEATAAAGVPALVAEWLAE